jgi:hypothetical protein
MTLYLKSIPVNISRWDLLEVVRNTPGFTSLSMSEPLKSHNFVRYAWVSYDSNENCRKAKEILDGKMLNDFCITPIKSQVQRKPIRITPPLPDDCIENDLDLCKKLIFNVFDPQKKIDFSREPLQMRMQNLK